MTLTIYMDHYCDACRAVLMFVDLLEIEYQTKLVSLLKGETQSKEYLEVNPLGTIPALDDDGFILTETVAILKYIARKYKVADHWYPEDLGQRARVDQFLAWHHTSIRKHILHYVFELVKKPIFTNQPADFEKVKAARPAVETSLNFLENYFLKDSEFLATNDVSVADLLGISMIRQISCTGYDVTKGRPKLAGWMSRVEARTNPHFDKLHKRIVDICQPYQFKE